ncbi:hypothetical protein DY240_22750 [Jiangella rhizosphaerae]|uniref:Berberine/berberine-like domain-containing protein n=1 Tax=Jiangella rhizosphaerae TaxID=2293569 RepID=A0A418KKW0_9ACTN|nr:BBE domain-containing protein [Jiangella rhizosphaerae]RIQ16660.1 hypothetical protein DY240_22750 [Jiangella rhizosphaerae]
MVAELPYDELQAALDDPPGYRNYWSAEHLESLPDEVCAAVRPWSTGAVYLNFIGDEGHSRVVSGFGTEGYVRPAEVKARYDAANLFRRNHNVAPA